MMYSVEVSARAESDLQQIADWLAERSPDGALRWIAAARKTIEGLSSDPEQHSLAPENDYLEVEVRNAFFKTRRGRTYRAVFVIKNKTVFVTHIRGPRQRPLSSREFE